MRLLRRSAVIALHDNHEMLAQCLLPGECPVMPKVTIYTTRFCPYCVAAKRLLARKNVAVDEIDVGGQPHLRQEMQAKAGGLHTVPQIWIGEVHVGGCDELYDLEDQGRLDALLAGEHEMSRTKA